MEKIGFCSFVFFFFSLCCVSVCVCVEREKRSNEEHGLFFCIKSDIDGAGEGEKLAKRKGYWSYQHIPSLLSRSLSLSSFLLFLKYVAALI